MSLLGAELPSPPTDGVTALRFFADTPLLLASSWDGVSDWYCCGDPSVDPLQLAEVTKGWGGEHGAAILTLVVALPADCTGVRHSCQCAARNLCGGRPGAGCCV